MIFNLYQYLYSTLPSLSDLFTVNGFSVGERLNEIALNETGGDVAHQYPRNDFTVQIIGRFNNVSTGRGQINQVYDALLNKFGLTLPEYDDGVLLSPAIVAWQISPIQSPSYLGLNQESMAMYSFNITVTIQEVATCQ
jgi:hypothetical protein